ncbi:hypothetical protein WR25_24818 [Diploscapter pachys]|uniref:Calcyclin-binding protein n=1 Tax=Diploscapter pachys TaxID=2018661 RepID=A0A2A2LQD8_9BILA|nr:hypothetical protein WR25_24818 [Diploscapter pachys]
MKVEVLASVLIIGFCSLTVEAQTCDPNSLYEIEKCYTTYLAGYNYTFSDTLPYYWDFHNRRLSMLEQQGTHIQPYICLLANKLSQCVRPYRCLSNSDPYMQMNAGNDTLALDWYTDLLVSEYECGPGYNVLMQDYYCMAYARQFHDAALNYCEAVMMWNISQGDDRCKAEQYLMTCQFNIYMNACDFNAGISADLEELLKLRSQANRANVQTFLDDKIQQLAAEQAKLTSVEQKPVTPQVTLSTSNTAVLPTIKLTNYAWDESDKFVKIYLTLPKIETLPADQIIHNFGGNNFDVFVNNLEGKNYSIEMKSLRDEIVPESSSVKQKTGDLLIMMKKKTEGKKWECLTKTEYIEKEKRKPKLDDKADADPQASLMTMMKQLYDDGDDEMKRQIRKTWHESQKKGGGGMLGGEF